MTIDVHCHLTDEGFQHDLKDVLDRAERAGVASMITMGIDPADNRAVLELARNHPQVKAGLGHYPSEPDDAIADENEELIRVNRSAIVAIGEVGIDYWIAAQEPEREKQKEIFSRFVRLAMELDLPLSVHSRSAGHYAIELLKDLGAKRVCMHAFAGKAKYALIGAEAGYYFSIPPSVARSPQKQKMVKALPLDRLLLESDAPYLGVDKDLRNEPANVMDAAGEIARIKDISVESVLAACETNTKNLFWY